MLPILIMLFFLGEAAYGQASEEYINTTNPEHEPIINRVLQINNILEHLPKEEPLIVLNGHPSFVQKVEWSSDNIHIATYAHDTGISNLVKIWNTQTGALLTGIGSGVEIKDFSWAPDGKRIAITHHTNKVWICDLAEVFEMEQAMDSLSAEQLSFVEQFIAENPLITLDKNQEKIFKKLPKVIKKSLTTQLDFNKEEVRPNPLR